jgi:hypothetical protein
MMMVVIKYVWTTEQNRTEGQQQKAEDTHDGMEREMGAVGWRT